MAKAKKDKTQQKQSQTQPKNKLRSTPDVNQAKDIGGKNKTRAVSKSGASRDIEAITIIDAIEQIRKIKDSITNNRPLEAWEGTLPVQQFLIATGRGFGLKSDEVTISEEDIETLRTELEEVKSLCDDLDLDGIEEQEGTIVAQRFGDGEFLKKLFDLFLILLPIILKPSDQTQESEDE